MSLEVRFRTKDGLVHVTGVIPVGNTRGCYILCGLMEHGEVYEKISLELVNSNDESPITCFACLVKKAEDCA